MLPTSGGTSTNSDNCACHCIDLRTPPLLFAAAIVSSRSRSLSFFSKAIWRFEFTEPPYVDQGVRAAGANTESIEKVATPATRAA